LNHITFPLEIKFLENPHFGNKIFLPISACSKQKDEKKNNSYYEYDNYEDEATPTEDYPGDDEEEISTEYDPDA